MLGFDQILLLQCLLDWDNSFNNGLRSSLNLCCFPKIWKSSEPFWKRRRDDGKEHLTSDFCICCNSVRKKKSFYLQSSFPFPSNLLNHAQKEEEEERIPTKIFIRNATDFLSPNFNSVGPFLHSHLYLTDLVLITQVSTVLHRRRGKRKKNERKNRKNKKSSQKYAA